MNSYAFGSGGFGNDLYLGGDPNADLNKYFEGTGNTPGNMDLEWGNFVDNKAPSSFDLDSAGQFPFPRQFTPDPNPSSLQRAQQNATTFSKNPESAMEELLAMPNANGFAQQGTMEASPHQHEFAGRENEQSDLSMPQLLSTSAYNDAPAQGNAIESQKKSTTRGTRSTSSQKVEIIPAPVKPEEQPKPVRRRGARKKQRTKEEAEQKREDHLKRNRDAAQKCRARKKEWENNLRANNHVLSARNQFLWNEFETLRQMVQIFYRDELPKFQLREADKEAVETFMAMEKSLSMNIQAMRESHDRTYPPRHAQEESILMEQSGSQQSHSSNDQANGPYTPGTVPFTPQQGAFVQQAQDISRPSSSSSRQTLYQPTPALNGYTTNEPEEMYTSSMSRQGSNRSFRQEVAGSMSRPISSASGRHSLGGFEPTLHRDSYDSGISNVDTPESRKTLESSGVDSPDTDEAIEDLTGFSPLQAAAHAFPAPPMMPSQRLPQKPQSKLATVFIPEDSDDLSSLIGMNYSP